MTIKKRYRVVFDTNVFVSATLSKSPTSPTRELIARWLNDEFTLLTNKQLISEIAEKLLARHISNERVTELLMLLGNLAEWVNIPTHKIERRIKNDIDDDVVLACALLEQADYLITYDDHFKTITGNIGELKITAAIPFLHALRE